MTILFARLMCQSCRCAGFVAVFLTKYALFLYCRYPGYAGSRHVRSVSELLLTDATAPTSRTLTSDAHTGPPACHDDGTWWPHGPPGHARAADSSESAITRRHGWNGTHTGHPRRINTNRHTSENQTHIHTYIYIYIYVYVINNWSIYCQQHFV